MNRKGQTTFLVVLIIAGIVLFVVDVYLYNQQVQTRSCIDDTQCGVKGFCDEGQRCQFPQQIIRNEQRVDPINKHDIKLGLFFLINGVIISIILLKPKNIKLFFKRPPLII